MKGSSVNRNTHTIEPGYYGMKNVNNPEGRGSQKLRILVGSIPKGVLTGKSIFLRSPH